MTKQELRELQNLFAQEMNLIAGQRGFKVRASGGTYTADESILKFTISLAGEVGTRAEREKWATHCGYFGLRASDYGRTFSLKGQTFTVTGFHLKASKRPVLATSSKNNELYKFTPSFVRTVLGGEQ